MKVFSKTIGKMFKHNLGRFFANLAIVLLSVTISSGLAALSPTYTDSYSKNYTENNVCDIQLKNKTSEGFKDEDIIKVKEDSDVCDVDTFFSMDFEEGEEIYRLYIIDLDSSISKLTLTEGELPSETYDFSLNLNAVSEINNSSRKTISISDKFNLKISFSLFNYSVNIPINLEICGFVNSPMYNSTQKENSYLTDENGELLDESYLSGIFYLDRKLLPELMNIQINDMSIPYDPSAIFISTDMYITYKEKSDYFTNAYEKEIDKKKDYLLKEFGEDVVAAMTLEDNVSYALYKNYDKKVSAIAYIFPFFFILVCALVNLIIITKLIKEERGIIGTYSSLGVPKGRIIFKYTLFTLISTLVGAFVGFIVGITLLPAVILPAYNAVFEMPSISFSNFGYYGIISAGILVVVALSVTIFSITKYLKETPASIMKGQSPKPGKKILLQRIPFLWKPLPFRFKSSFRNIFRQKKNLILTSLSIIGSTLLVLIGFSLLDVSKSLVNDTLFGNVASSMGTISTIIILFAISMAVIVIYSLANMNIGDREREIATLKVLGYHDKECSMYTFREIAIISVFACIIGLPISTLIIAYVLEYLDFGNIKDVEWYSYLLTFVIIIMTMVIVNILLYPKIKKINMNDSLKTLE